MLFKKTKKQEKIIVVFIAQYIHGCDKFITVVNSMKANSMFDVKVLAFPENISLFPKNNEFEFWKSKFGDITLNSICDEEWIDLKQIMPDYVFVQRPYDMYLPDAFSIKNMASYTKICYIPYGFVLHTENKLVLSEDFLSNLYIYFAENSGQDDYAKKVFNKLNDDKVHFSFDLGYPVLDTLKVDLINQNSAFNELNNCLKVIWTPRWTIDNNISGTSFFKYKDNFIDYFNKNFNDQLVFRPHPMTFKNFVDSGLMTLEEVNEYISNFDNYNMTYDVKDSYYDTFYDSDILITDFSSIVVEYLFYNKPIIMCERNEKKFNKSMREITKCLYIANNWKEIVKYVNDIKNGVDPLKKERQKLIAKYKKIYDGNVSDRILKVIKNDYINNKD